MNVGFIGLGIMGLPMASHLAKAAGGPEPYAADRELLLGVHAHHE